MATSDNRWEEAVTGRTVPRTLLSKRFKSEEERIDAIRIDVIRAWRLDRHKKGLPSGLNDCFIDKDICPACKGTGKENDFTTNYPETCFRCCGLGRFFAPD
jgi:hypothetical protein